MKRLRSAMGGLLSKGPGIRLHADDAVDSPKVRMPLRTKITLPYLGLALALALGASLLMSKIIFDSAKQQFSNQVVDAGRLASKDMVAEESRMLSTLRLLSFTDGVSDALLNSDPVHLRELTFGVVVNDHAEAVEFLGPRGDTILSMRHIPGGNPEEYYFSSGDRFFSEMDMVTRIMKNKTDSLGDKYSGVIETDMGDFFYVSGPVVDEQGRLMGILLVGKALDSLVREIREHTLAQVTVYSPEGEPISSTFSNPVAIDPTLAEEILTSHDAQSIKRELGSRRDLTGSNGSYAELLGPWEARGQDDLGIMGVSLSESSLVNASLATRIQLLLLLTLAIALVILLGINLGSLITRPLSRLAQATHAVERGEAGVSVDLKTNDELELLARSFNEMVTGLDRSKAEFVQAYDSTLLGWSHTLELRDREEFGHTSRVAQMARDFASSLGVEGEQLVALWRGALLHDIGKMGIPDAILNKPGRLTEEEWHVMRQHPQMAEQFLKDIPFLKESLAIPLYHHEHWDGSGYPRGLKGEEIPLAARIFALVDVWDAITSQRPYRPGLTREEAQGYILEQTGRYFDPALVEPFLNFVREYRGEKI